MSGSVLIKNARIWPSASEAVMEDGSILIERGLIARMGKFKARADTMIDADGCLVMPGFIQTHVHLCQTLFRGIAEDLPLLPWLRDYIWPLEAAHDPDSIRASALLACAEMIRGGTTLFVSMETVRHTDAALAAVQQSGMMGVVCPCFMDDTGGYPPLSVGLDDALADCDRLLEEWGEHDCLQLGLAPRFALSCSADNMRHAADYARDQGLLLHTHAAEQPAEIKWILENTGMHNIEYLQSVGLTGPDVLLAHCVHTLPHERTILEETDTRVLHCPSANLKLGSGIAPIPEYLSAGISISIGADGAPCNNRLDMFLEMREAGLIQKPRLGPDAMPARDLVMMATEGGAAAIHREREMGTLEIGKRANLIMLDPRNVHVVPSEDPATNVVYGHQAADVVLTMVNGEILYEDGELTTIDEEDLHVRVQQEHLKLLERAGFR